jgi:hypothetical protein
MQCNGNINQTFIIETIEGAPTMSACTGVYTNAIISCDSDTQISLNPTDIIINKSLLPSDLNIDLGSIGSRFRTIHTISGSSTFWSATTVSTLNLDLGLDNSGEQRTITANNSMITNDILNGGGY